MYLFDIDYVPSVLVSFTDVCGAAFKYLPYKQLAGCRRLSFLWKVVH